MIDYDDIKARHRIEDVLYKRGVELRRASGGWQGRCPIHGEQNGSSFSVNEKKQLWFCHGKCGRGGSVLDLIMALDGAESALAASEILEGRPLTEEEKSRPRPAPAQSAQWCAPRELPAAPKMFRGQERHWQQVAALRKLDMAAASRADKEGCLRFCLAYEQPAYAVLDVDNPCNIQVRRMDGGRWFERAKVMGIKGNWASWPVGLSAALRHPAATVLLVEGTGDFLAGWDIHTRGEHDVVPVAMFGASQDIHPGALPLFDGRHVVIAEQHDPAGCAAADRWQSQLQGIACVRRWRMPNEGHDLNDHLSAGGDFQTERIALP